MTSQIQIAAAPLQAQPLQAQPVFLTYQKLPVEELHLFFRAAGYEEVKYDAQSDIVYVELHVRPIICLENENVEFSDNMMKMYEPNQLPRNLEVIEMEAFVILGGSFRDQFPQTNERMGHNPNKSLVRMKASKDTIAFTLNASKSIEDGFARWEIPVLFFESGSLLRMIHVVQEYTIQDGVLRVSKGLGMPLLEYPLRNKVRPAHSLLRLSNRDNEKSKCCCVSS